MEIGFQVSGSRIKTTRFKRKRKLARLQHAVQVPS